MVATDCFIMIGIGGFLLLIAPVFFVWARRQESGLDRGLMHRRDLREYITRWPPRIDPLPLHVGGWLCIALGVGLVALGGALLIWG